MDSRGHSMNLRLNRLRLEALVWRALLCCLVGATSGCTILSVMDLATAGQEDKQRTLGERVTKFHRELSWGSGTTYIEFIETSKRTEMSRQYRQAQEVEKLVDLEVRDT